MKETFCIACGNHLQIKDTKLLGDFVTCPVCWSIFEIVHLNPIKIYWPEDPQVMRRSPPGRYLH